MPNRNRLDNILLIESSMDGVPGGSFYSARLLIKGLIDKGYNTYILFYIQNPIMESFANSRSTVLRPIYKKIKRKIPKNNSRDTTNSTKNILVIDFLKFFFNYANKCKFVFYELYQLYYIIKTIKKNKIKIVHLNDGITSNRDGIIAAKLCGVKCIVHERKIRKYNRFDIFLSKFIDTLVAISNSVYENCMKCSIQSKQTVRIYNPIIRINPDPIKVNEIREKYDNLIILSVIGNIIPWKGQLTFLKAIDMIFHRHGVKNFKALIIGGVMNYDYYQKLKDFCKDNRIENLVEFIDFVNDIENYIQASDIVIHTSNKPEPFGRIVVEALVLGKKVIASDQGGPNEIIESGKNGLLFDAQNPEELAHKIIHILDGKFNMDSDMVAKDILERFSLDRHVEKVIRFCYTAR